MPVASSTAEVSAADWPSKGSLKESFLDVSMALSVVDPATLVVVIVEEVLCLRSW